MELARLGGNFWEDGLNALVRGVPNIRLARESILGEGKEVTKPNEKTLYCS